MNANFLHPGCGSVARRDPIDPKQRLRERTEPAGRGVMRQRWSDLLFLHWSYPAELIASRLPPGLKVDTFDNRAWVGVVPFRMHGVRPSGLPALPGVSAFPEINLRTYVLDGQGRPGVWFFSLDTPRRLANWIARRFFHLNYRLAHISTAAESGSPIYRARLRGDESEGSLQCYRWKCTGPEWQAETASLAFFLVERYRLFSSDKTGNRLFTGCVRHEPYSLLSVELEDWSERLFELSALPRPGRKPESILASPGVDVRIHPLRRVTASR